jgi:guanylate kinase
VAARLRKAEDEEPVGLRLADHVVINDDLDSTVEEMLDIIEQARRASDQPAETTGDGGRPR